MTSASAGGARGVRLGVDVGSVRVGVAVCDPDGILATPLVTLDRTSTDAVSAEDADVRDLVALVRERNAVGVVMGLPTSLSGVEGDAAKRARAYAAVLAARIAPVEVRLVDERFTTVDAHRSLRESGVSGRRARSVVDQAAAVLILQSALDHERATGGWAGEVVGPARRKPRRKGTKA